MADVKTEPVKATFQTDAEFWDRGTPFTKGATPGGILVDPENEDGEPGIWWYSCPCGCGHVGRLKVGAGVKPPSAPSWGWTGGVEAATLEPSVHHVGHWHGWLRGGVWVSC